MGGAMLVGGVKGFRGEGSKQWETHFGHIHPWSNGKASSRTIFRSAVPGRWTRAAAPLPY